MTRQLLGSREGEWEESRVLEEIRRQAGKKFDPEIVEIFFENMENMRSLRLKYPDVKE